ncbi:hypothetical protein B0J13DRAFT_669572 [Dactylonectria estremocensis]|uniref:Uncharacterized protein n=1 Tax=Dactylonectria estremocensis TaxID=1079267 RepID=A0A9P9FHQ7_9HYPO|nr:hypothetical protein B0J13DRAFT_669572 [Dactylonectria estremocensis]
MDEFVEFYITCNPPLLPAGVADVVAHVRKAPLSEHVIEILYEPDISWFKIITASKHQEEVSTLIESFLEERLEAETDIIDERHAEIIDTEGDGLQARPDVDLVVENPSVIPWSLYHQQQANTNNYDEYRFPTPLETLPYKAVWRGLEKFNNLSISDLLLKYDFLWPRPSPGYGMQKLVEHFDWEFTHNMRGNIVYMGSRDSAECLKNATLKLDNLVAFQDSLLLHSSHLIFTEDEEILEVSYRWLTHVGLDKLTYPNICISRRQTEKLPLNRAASIRTQITNAQGHSVPDNTSYPIVSGTPVAFKPSFSPFVGFAHRAKRPGSPPVAALKQVAAVPPPHQITQLATAAPSSCSESPAPILGRVGVLAATGASHGIESGSPDFSCSTLAEPGASQGDVGKHRHHRSWVGIPLQPSSAAEPGSTSRLLKPLAATEAVASWIEGIETVEFQTPPGAMSELMSPEEVPAMTNSDISFVGGNLINLEPDTESSVPPPNDSESNLGAAPESGNLIQFEPPYSHDSTTGILHGMPEECLMDLEVPQGPSCGMFDLVNLLQVHANLADSQVIPSPVSISTPNEDLLGSVEGQIYTPALMDTSGGGNTMISSPNTPGSTLRTDLGHQVVLEADLVRISRKMDSRGKELQHTMGQQVASKPTPTWANVASQLSRQTKDEDTFGINIPVTRQKLKKGGPVSKTSKPASSSSTSPHRNVQIDSKPSRSSAQEQAASLQVSKEHPPSGCAKIYLGELAHQKRLMRERREISSKRHQEVETREDAERRERIQKKLQALELAPEKKTEKKESPPKRDGSSHPMRIQQWSLEQRPKVHDQAGAYSRRTNSSRIIGDAEMKVKELFKVLQITPGLIRLEARFGRICINDVPDNNVNLGKGPSWDAREEPKFDDDDRIGFHTTLTTNGAEVDLMPGLFPSKGRSLTVSDKQVYYDITCTSKDRDDIIVIEIDASNFTYVCRSPNQELPGVYIHCAKRAWDIQLSARRVSFGEVPEDFRQFASSLVESLSISTSEGGQVSIETMPDKDARWDIAGANIRHIAMYHNSPKGRNYLTITLTRVVQRVKRSNYQGTTMPVKAPGKEALSQWFEASIGSARADDLLGENVGLEFGDKTSWTPKQLVKEGIIKALCGPALKMVAKMDQIGETNRNDEGMNLGRGASASANNSGDDYVFW